MPFRLVIGGPCNSGKSTLAVSLAQAVRQYGVVCGLHELDIYSSMHTHITGETPWEKRTKCNDITPGPELVRTQEVSARFGRDLSPVVIGDLPGRCDSPRDLLVTHARAAILIARAPDGFREWEEVLSERHVPILARTISYHGRVPSFDGINFFFEGLNRESKHNDREIQGLARYLIAAHVHRAVTAAE